MDVISNSEPYRSILLEKELVKKKKKKTKWLLEKIRKQKGSKLLRLALCKYRFSCETISVPDTLPPGTILEIIETNGKKSAPPVIFVSSR